MNETTLQLPGEVRITDEADALYDELAADLLDVAREAVEQRGQFHLALSGGGTPEPFYVRLVIDPTWRTLPWKQTHIWLVDERWVPREDARSNFRMIREALITQVPTPAEQVHPVPTTSADPADAYEAAMREVFGNLAEAPSLDWVLLGMGDDAHTASLFPQSAALDVTDRWIANNDGPNVVPPPRITMTYPLLNAARNLRVLVTGAKKHATLRRIEQHMKEHGPDPSVLPITGVSPARGNITWFLDGPAAMGAGG